MTQSLKIFMEYKIVSENVEQYEQLMKEVVAALEDYEATNVQWFVAADQPNLYVEMFEVPTKSHYHVLKRLRQSDQHHVFGKLAPFVVGGAKGIHCWAFEKKK